MRGNAQHTSPADFAFCRVEPHFKNPEPIANSKFTEEEMNEINVPPEKGISLKTVNIFEAVTNFAPGWGVVNCGNGWQPGLRKWWGGRDKVLVTHPVSKDIPCVLSKTVDVPAGKKTTLSIDVGHHPDGDWMLVIKADGDLLV